MSLMASVDVEDAVGVGGGALPWVSVLLGGDGGAGNVRLFVEERPPAACVEITLPQTTAQL